MIRISQLGPLLRAKLSARFGRSLLIISVASMLFGISLAGYMIFNGSINSLHVFSNEMYQGRQLVQATYLEDSESLLSNEYIQQEAQNIYENDVAEMNKSAQELGLEFDSTLLEPPLNTLPGGNSNEFILNLMSPSAQKAVEKYRTMHPSGDADALHQLAMHYGASNVYAMSGLSAKEGFMSLMRNEREVYSSFSDPIDTSYDFIANTPVRIVDEAAMNPFTDLNIHTSSSEIPIIVPYSAARTIVNIQSESNTPNRISNSDEIRQLVESAKGITFSVCYRNASSKKQIDQALMEGSGSQSEKTNAITYELPDGQACNPAKIASDTRTAIQRIQDDKMQIFNSQFDIEPLPIQKTLSFKIVGVMPDTIWTSDNTEGTIVSMAQSLLGPSLLGQATITTQTYNRLPATLKSIFEIGSADTLSQNKSYLVEFSDIENAQKFIEEQSCDRSSSGCENAGDSFQLVSFGSSGVTSANLQRITTEASIYVVVSIVIIATIIMAGTFGRIIVDEKQEMAVFRALGATRLDITIIYIVYAMILSFFAAFIAVVIGLLLTTIAQNTLALELTEALRVTYGILDETVVVNLFSVDGIGIILIVCTILLTGLISVTLPLQAALNRLNVIEDLKT
jgi:cell division protein FtsX